MGKADWSLDNLERELAVGFSLLDRVGRSGGMARGESGDLADGVLQCMNGALMKVSQTLEEHARLRRELAQAREEFRRSQAVQAERIEALEDEAASLRRALDEERQRSRRMLARLDTRQGSPQPQHAPPDDHLDRPLVLRSQQGDFLGVTDRSGQALNLSGFQRLIEGGTYAESCENRTERLVASCWEQRAGNWYLTVCISGDVLRRRCYVLETRAVLTPSGNKVTQLSAITVGGSPVPQNYVLQMFRHLRDSFQEQ
ncbi:MreC domain-containing protein [Humidesulfovibrio sp.]